MKFRPHFPNEHTNFLALALLDEGVGVESVEESRAKVLFAGPSYTKKVNNDENNIQRSLYIVCSLPRINAFQRSTIIFFTDIKYGFIGFYRNKY